MHFFVYNVFVLLFFPAIVFFLIIRAVLIKQTSKSIKEQLGIVDVIASSDDILWIHAVSVGETVASAGVADELLRQYPDLSLVFSTTTQSGHEQATKSIKNYSNLIYYPYDFYFCVANAIRKVKPKVFASTDTEIWPNFRFILKRRGVKSAIINGIISDGTLRGAKMFDWLYRWTLGNIDLFCMQSDEDAQRVIKLGADPTKVFVTGNCKADTAEQSLTDSERATLFTDFFPYGHRKNDYVFVAGSTNPGEDIPVIKAYVKAKEIFPNLKMIIAPRQIERREEIIKMLNDYNLTYHYRSNSEMPYSDFDVLILDTMGELAKAYFVGDLSFVGGSLVKKGCHSILQPIAAGIAVCFGPYYFKAKDLVSQAKHFNIGFEINSADELCARLISILGNKSEQIRIKDSCGEMLASNKGASEKTASMLLALLNEKKKETSECKKIKFVFKDNRKLLILEKILSGSNQLLAAKIYRVLMYPFSLLYVLIHIIYLLPYNLGIRKKYKSCVPVISIGNITMGGTGKTPLAAKLVSILNKSKISCCILTRGYGRKSKDMVYIDPFQKDLNVDVYGDEPILLSRLTNVPVIIGRDRRKSAEFAIKKYSPDVIILDDGLQFWQMYRDLDIVVVKSNSPFGSGLTVPAGDLRERKQSLKRAGIIMSNGDIRISDVDLGKLKKTSPNSNIFNGMSKLNSLSFADKTENIDFLNGKRVYAFCGIAYPMRFIESLKVAGAQVLSYDFFLDHHKYTASDMTNIINKSKSENIDLVITTQKDISRIGNGYELCDNLCTLDISFDIEDEQNFTDLVISYIEGKK